MIEIDKLHTTPLGKQRISRNLDIKEDEVMAVCCRLINDSHAIIDRMGKNFYVTNDNIQITINAHSNTIITAHKTIATTD